MARAELFDGTVLDFEDGTPDAVIEKVARQETERIHTEQARKPLPAGVQPSAAGGGRGLGSPPVAGAGLATPVEQPAPQAPAEKPANAGRVGWQFGGPDYGPGGSVLDRPADPSWQQSPEQAAQQDAQLYAERAPPRPDPNAPQITGTMSATPREVIAGQAVRDATGSSGAGAAVQGAVSGYAELGKVGAGLVAAGADLVGAKDVSAFALGAAQKAENFSQAAQPQGGYYEKLIGNVFSSTVQSLPTLMFGVGGATEIVGGKAVADAAAKRAMTASMRELFVQTSSQKYADLRNKGFEPLPAAAASAIEGQAEVWGERFGFHEQMAVIRAAIGKKTVPVGQLGQVWAREILKEIPGEELTTAIEFINDKYGFARTSPQATLQDYFQQAADTAVQTIGQTALMGAPAGIRSGAAGVRGVYRRADAAMAYDQAGRNGFHVEPPVTTDAPDVQRKKTDAIFQAIAAQYGIAKEAVKRAVDAAQSMPLPEVGGFYKRMTQALTKRGLTGAPVDEHAADTLDAGPIDPPPETKPGQTGSKPAQPEKTKQDAAVDSMAAILGQPAPPQHATDPHEPTDLTTADGQPYGTRASAQQRATKEGAGDVVEVAGGWVVRPAAETAAPSAPAAPITTAQAEAAPAPPAAAPPEGPSNATLQPSDQGQGQEKGLLTAAAPTVPPAGAEQAPAATTPEPAPAPTAPTTAAPAAGARVIGHVGTTPNSTEPLELRPNEDGTHTPWIGKNPLVDFESGEPIKLPAGATNQQAKDAITKARALGNNSKIFRFVKDAPGATPSAPSAPPAPAPPVAAAPAAPTVADIHALADARGVPWDNDAAFMARTKKITGKEHLDDLDGAQRAMLHDHLQSLPDKAIDAHAARDAMSPEERAKADWDGMTMGERNRLLQDADGLRGLSRATLWDDLAPASKAALGKMLVGDYPKGTTPPVAEAPAAAAPPAHDENSPEARWTRMPNAERAAVSQRAGLSAKFQHSRPWAGLAIPIQKKLRAAMGEAPAGAPPSPADALKARIHADVEKAGGKIIGQNTEGEDIREDSRGVRSITRDGVRNTEAVGMRPTREGVKLSVEHKGEYLTAAEAKAQTATADAAASDKAPATAPVEDLDAMFDALLAEETGATPPATDATPKTFPGKAWDQAQVPERMDWLRAEGYSENQVRVFSHTHWQGLDANVQKALKATPITPSAPLAPRRAPKEGPAQFPGKVWDEADRDARRAMLVEIEVGPIADTFIGRKWMDLSANMRASLLAKRKLPPEKAAKQPRTPQVPNEPGVGYVLPGFATHGAEKLPRTAGAAAASAAANTAKAVDNAIDGLGALFGGPPSTLNKGPSRGQRGAVPGGFDEDTYAKARPMFVAALGDLKAAIADLKEAMRKVLRMVLDRFGVDAAKRMQPYIVRFITDVHEGKVKLGVEDNAAKEPIDEQTGRNPGAVDKPPEPGDRPVLADGKPARDGSDRPLANPPAEDGGAPGTPGHPAATGARAGSPTVRDAEGKPGGGNDANGRPGTSDGGLAADGAGNAGHPVRSGPARSNYHVADPESLIGGSPKVRFARNRAAIEALNNIAADGREPLPAELDSMAAYIGWGSFGQELFNGSWERPRPKEAWAKEDAWLREHLGKVAWQAAQESIINAHYTDPISVGTMWDMVRALGFKGGRVLEPSCAIGNFFGMMPRDMMAASQLTGIEMDPTSGAMAKLLYPEANIQIKAYQDSKTADDFYDLVIGNWPFAAEGPPGDRRYAKLNPSLHDYFFLKALDQTRPGGIVIGITSAGTMDKKGRATRMELGKKGELLASFRLPSGAFEKYAGTKVVTDILVFRKRAKPLADTASLPWIDLADFQPKDGEKFGVNRYYVEDHPDHVLGTLNFGSGSTYGRPSMIVDRPDNLLELLQALPGKMPENAYTPRTGPDDGVRYVSNNTADRQGALTFGPKDGLFVVRGDQLAPLEDVTKYRVKDPKETARREAQLRALIGIRRAYGALIDAERAGGENVEALRTALRTQYQAFVKAHGAINGSEGLKILDKIKDPFYATLAALEHKGKPALILTQSTVRAVKKLENASVRDAFVAARNHSLHLDLGAIAAAAKTTEGAAIAELEKADAIYRTPAGPYEVSDVYLAGNVRRKLREVQDAIASGDKGLQRNVDALTKVVPKTVPYFLIEAKLGAPWVSHDDYHQFVAEMLNVAGKPDAEMIAVTFVSGSWKVRFTGDALNQRPEASTKWGMPRSVIRFDKLLTAALNNRSVTIKYKDQDGVWHVNEHETTQANEKITLLREHFSTWVWADSDRKTRLQENYNEVMNAVANPSYDGAFLEFPGMALQRGTDPFSLRSHQVNAIWRALVNGSGLYAHEVGTGKTYTMAGIAVEARRYGLAKKPLLFAHNANSAAVAREINDMYPGARVLYIDNLAPGEIDLTMRKIANDDWDVVVVPHSLIDRFSLTKETLDGIVAEDIAALEQEALDAAAEDGVPLTEDMMDDPDAMKKVRSATAKELVKARNQIKKKVADMVIRSSREGALSFEELGVDMVIVDEAHEFKKPPLVTKMKMKGLNAATSNRSIALRFLTDYVKNQNNGRGVFTFTGTPITNTLAEIYNQMRYVMDDQMKRDGIKDWDTWFASFADSATNVEITTSGEHEAVTTLSKFVNVAELRRIAGQYMDIVFADDMPEFKPRPTSSGKIASDPSLTAAERDQLLTSRSENPVGRPYKKVIVDTAPMSPEQEAAHAEHLELDRLFKNASKKDRRDMMAAGHPASPVILETAVSNAALDLRLVNMDAADVATSKVNRVVGNVKRHYDEHPQATQVIFVDRGYTDIGTSTKTNPDGSKRVTKHRKFNLAKDIVNKLVAQGIPREQIAIVDGSMSKEARKAVADAMNWAEIRVVIGQTATLGVGVNMQTNLRAMHHLDAPWMPGELEQRNGRGWRQGNKWDTVLEYRYVTEVMDGKRWQVLARKAFIIKSFLQADENLRIIDGDAAGMDEEGSDIESTLAEAAGDPRLLIKAKLAADVVRLETRQRMHAAGTGEARAKAKQLREDRYSWGDTATAMEVDSNAFLAAKELPFDATVGKAKIDKRADFDAALAAYAAEAVKPDDTNTTLGHIYGLRIVGYHPKWAGGVMVKLVRGNQTYDVSPLIQSIDGVLRNVTKRIADARAQVVEDQASAAGLEEQAKLPFQQADALAKKRQMLHDLEVDLQQNPTPSPAWLRNGAPVGVPVWVDGDPIEVQGHRWTNAGYFIVTEEGDVPYLDVRDESGFPVYEPHDFKRPATSLAGQKLTDSLGRAVEIIRGPFGEAGKERMLVKRQNDRGQEIKEEVAASTINVPMGTTHALRPRKPPVDARDERDAEAERWDMANPTGAPNVPGVVFRDIARPKLREQTPGFKHWFKGSKVVDEAGEPAVQYHATTRDFDEFKPGGFDATLSGPAIWLTPNPTHQPAAHNVGGGQRGFKPGTRVMPVYVKMLRPLVIDDKTMLDWAQAAFADGSKEFPDLLAPKWVAEIKAEGYDGILFTSRADSPETIVFSGEQIKSAIGNSGAFDPANPSIVQDIGRRQPQAPPKVTVERFDNGLPVFNGDGIRLEFPEDTHRFEVIPGAGQRLVNYVVMPSKGFTHLGHVVVLIEGGKPVSLVDINMQDKRGGSGAKVVETLLAAFPGSAMNVSNIVQDARGFWQKMGVPEQNLEHGAAYDGTLDWKTYAAARVDAAEASAVARRGRAPGISDATGAGRSGRADGAASGPGGRDSSAWDARRTGRPDAGATDRVSSLHRLGDQLARQGWEKASVPQVQAAAALQKLIEDQAAGKLDAGAFTMRVKVLADRMTAVVDTKAANRLMADAELVRDVDHVRAELLEARRNGDLAPETVEFALWLLAKNPALAANLAISIEAPGKNTPAGEYRPALELLRLFKGEDHTDTAVHEILHHIERMLPPAMQAAIRKEWARALAAAIKKGTPDQVAALSNIPAAMTGDKAAYQALVDAIQGGPLNYAEHYPLTNPSEFWAVNGARILGEHRAAGSIWQQIRQFMRELVQKVRQVLGLPSTAPIIRALHYVTDASHFGVERGGRFESERMLSEAVATGNGGGLASLAERRAVPDDTDGGRALREDPAFVVKGDEIADFTPPRAIRPIRKAVQAYGEANLVGKYTNSRSGLTIEVRRGGISEALSHGSAIDKLKAFVALPSVLEDGVVVYDGPDLNNPRIRFVAVSRRVKIGGVDFFVTAGAHEGQAGRLYYDHALLEIGRADTAIPSMSSKPADPPAPSSTRINDMTRAFLAQNASIQGAAADDGTLQAIRRPGQPPAQRSLLSKAIHHPLWHDATNRLQFAPGRWLYDTMGEAAGPLLARIGMKPMSKALAHQMRTMKLQVQKAQEQAAAVVATTNEFSAGERDMISDIVEQELAAGATPPAAAIRMAALMSQTLSAQSAELVALDMLSQQAADRWDGKYLPRFYESKLRKQVGDAWADAARRLLGRTSVMKGIKGNHLKMRGKVKNITVDELADHEALGWEVRDGDYIPGTSAEVQIWRDYTRQERDDMGEIRDAGFRFVMGYMQTQRDLALGRMFAAMAADPEQSARLQPQGKDWVPVPRTIVEGTGVNRYGKLAGRFVPRETLSHLSQIEEASSEAWQFYRKGMSLWKEGKTVLNPASHVNNTVGNLTMAQLAGVGYHRADKYVGAFKDFIWKAPMVTEARDAGLFLGSMSDTELMKSLPKELKDLVVKADSSTVRGARFTYNLMTLFLRQPLGHAYAAEDTFFRYLIYKDARQRGLAPSDAVDYAQEYIFTYDDLPRGARMVRDFGIPFFAYTYKAIPMMLHTSLSHPVRFGSAAALIWVANAAAYALAAGDDDDDWYERLRKYATDADYRKRTQELEDKEQASLPPWMRGQTAMFTRKTIRLGTDAVTHLPLFIDVSRLIPGSDLNDIKPHVAGAMPLPQLLTPSHPVFTLMNGLLGNVDLWTGKPIVDNNDTMRERAGKGAEWMWKLLSPTLTPGNTIYERGMDALAQAGGGEIPWLPNMLTDNHTGIGKDGLPVQPGYAAAQTMGIKVRPQDLEKSERIDQSMKIKMLKDIERELIRLKRLENAGAIKPKVFEQERVKAIDKMRNVREGLTVDGAER